MKRLVWVTTPKDWTSADRETLKQQVVEATMNGGVIVAEEGVELEIIELPDVQYEFDSISFKA